MLQESSPGIRLGNRLAVPDLAANRFQPVEYRFAARRKVYEEIGSKRVPNAGEFRAGHAPGADCDGYGLPRIASSYLFVVPPRAWL